jgi:hypothetical protein
MRVVALIKGTSEKAMWLSNKPDTPGRIDS